MRNVGLVETVELRQRGWPYRQTFEEFAERYNFARLQRSAIEICEEILRKSSVSPEMWKLGRARVFMKAPQFARLEKLRQTYQNKLMLAIMCQSLARSWLARRQLCHLMREHRLKIEEERRRRAEAERKREQELRRKKEEEEKLRRKEEELLRQRAAEEAARLEAMKMEVQLLVNALREEALLPPASLDAFHQLALACTDVHDLQQKLNRLRAARLKALTIRKAEEEARARIEEAFRRKAESEEESRKAAAAAAAAAAAENEEARRKSDESKKKESRKSPQTIPTAQDEQRDADSASGSPASEPPSILAVESKRRVTRSGSMSKVLGRLSLKKLSGKDKSGTKPADQPSLNRTSQSTFDSFYRRLENQDTNSSSHSFVLQELKSMEEEDILKKQTKPNLFSSEKQGYDMAKLWLIINAGL
jgi:myosin heavy subunit